AVEHALQAVRVNQVGDAEQGHGRGLLASGRRGAENLGLPARRASWRREIIGWDDRRPTVAIFPAEGGLEAGVRPPGDRISVIAQEPPSRGGASPWNAAAVGERPSPRPDGERLPATP